MPPQPPPEQSKNFLKNWWSLQSRAIAIDLSVITAVLILFAVYAFLNGEGWTSLILLWPFLLILVLLWFCLALLLKRYGFGNIPAELQKVTKLSVVFAVVMAIALVVLFAFLFFADPDTIISILMPSSGITTVAAPILGVLGVLIAVLVLRVLFKKSKQP
ncbi:MAG: hypothetical protein Q8Q36_02050 [bacterium]|nr:hypothetical protein [bacterium]